jgi:hypothetical protein
MVTLAARLSLGVFKRVPVGFQNNSSTVLCGPVYKQFTDYNLIQRQKVKVYIQVGDNVFSGEHLHRAQHPELDTWRSTSVQHCHALARRLNMSSTLRVLPVTPSCATDAQLSTRTA